MKRKMTKLAATILTAVLLSMPMVLANTEPGTTSVSVDNEVPTNPIPAQAYYVHQDSNFVGTNSTAPVDPLADTSTTVKVVISAEDRNGGDDIASAYCIWWDPDELRYEGAGTVEGSTVVGNNVNVSCTQELYYYDQTGSWTVEVRVTDESGTNASINTTTFVYAQLVSIDVNATSISWSNLNLGQNDTISGNVLNVNNTGNAYLDVSLKGTDLTGAGGWEIGIGNVTYDDDDTIGGDTGWNEADYSTSYALWSGTDIDNEVLEVNEYGLGSSTFEKQLYSFIDVPTTLKDQAYSGTVSICAAVKGTTCT